MKQGCTDSGEKVKPLSEAPDIDIVDLLRMHGYGVVEGADEVRKKIKEMK